MPLVVKDRVRETSTTTNTGTLTLNGAVSNFQSFSVIGDGNTTYYTITLDSAGEWEVGIGTYTASGTTLSRDVVLESSNGGSLVPFSAGTKNVFCTYPAERAVYSNEANTTVTVPSLTDSGNLTFTGTGNRIIGNFGTGTVDTRILFQNSNSDAQTNIVAVENGTTSTATGAAQLVVAESSYATNGNAALGALSLIKNTDVRISSGILNSGTYLPLTFFTGGSERVRIPTTGDVEIGTQALGATTDTRKVTIASNGYAVLTLNGDYSDTAGEPGGSGIQFDVDGSGSPNAVVSFVNTAGTRGDSSTAYTGTTANTLLVGTVSGNLLFGTNNAVKATLSTAGNLGMGVTPLSNVRVEITPPISGVPLKFNPASYVGVQGAFEYDLNTLVFTNDTNDGIGFIPVSQIFDLNANGTAFGPAIGNFFGANSAASVQSGSFYELEAYCRFTKTTAGTVTVTLTSSVAPQNVSGTVDYGAATGGTATGASNRISLYNSALAAAAFGASASLTTAVSHTFTIRAIIETNATTAGNIRINFTSSAGTVTPLRGSYYKLTRLPLSNQGNFVA